MNNPKLDPDGNPIMTDAEFAEHLKQPHMAGVRAAFTPLDEATAFALVVILNNHIEALKAWRRKLTTPYMPKTRSHLAVVPEFPKPTLLTVRHITKSSDAFTHEVRRVLEREKV